MGPDQIDFINLDIIRSQDIERIFISGGPLIGAVVGELRDVIIGYARFIYIAYIVIVGSIPNVYCVCERIQAVIQSDIAFPVIPHLR